MIHYMCQNKKEPGGLLEKSKCLRCGKLGKQSLQLNITMMHEDFLRLSNNTSEKCCKNSSMCNYILDLNHHITAVTRDERWPRPKEKGRFKTTNNNTWHGTKDRTGFSSREGEKHKWTSPHELSYIWKCFWLLYIFHFLNILSIRVCMLVGKLKTFHFHLIFTSQNMGKSFLNPPPLFSTKSCYLFFHLFFPFSSHLQTIPYSLLWVTKQWLVNVQKN